MAYSTIKEVVQTGGFYKSVADAEAVGTGDDSEVSFSLANNPIVEGSEAVYLDGVLQTVTTDYTLNSITGVITFVAAPGTDVAITATYWYFGGITIDSNVVSDLIEEADALVEEYTGRKWDSNTATSEVYDGNGEDYLILKNYPVLTVTALTIDSTSITPAYVYVYPDEGKIVLSDSAEENTFLTTAPQNVTITYTYGSATTPVRIKALARKLAALMGLVSTMGGTFDDITSWTVGSETLAKGEPYVNLLRTAERLDQEIKRILLNVRKRPIIK